MRKRTIMVAAGVLLTAGAIAAISAPGPRGHRGGMWGEADMMQPDGPHGGARGPRGWFGPRSITLDEYDARTRERFARLDKNSDGVIDASEIEATIAQRGGRFGRNADAKGGPAGRGDQFLRRFGDKDGRVAKDAFLTEAKRRFTQLDLNNDGKITDEDLPPLMRGKGVLKANGPNLPGPMARMITDLRQADAKQDGIITLEAFMAHQTKRFDELDRNKDGVVDKADFELMRKDMADYMVKRFLHAYEADASGKVTKEQFFKVAKERFARLDRKGEGKITFDAPGGGERGGRWFGRNRDGGQDGADGGERRDRGGPPPAPKN